MSTLLSSATVVLLAAAAAAAATTSMHGAERVSVRVSPGFSFAPADVTINAIVEPNPANRAIEVEADSGGYVRRSKAGLDGDDAPRANQFRFTSLPAGVYRIRVAVRGASGQELGSAVAEITVIGDAIDETSRVQTERLCPGDVAAGATLGTVAGRFRRRDHKVTTTPAAAPGGAGVSFTVCRRQSSSRSA